MSAQIPPAGHHDDAPAAPWTLQPFFFPSSLQFHHLGVYSVGVERWFLFVIGFRDQA